MPTNQSKLVPQIKRIIAHRDARGLVFEPIESDELCSQQNCHVVMSLPGQVRGNHYHPLTAEWFTVVMGKAEVVLSDVETGETRHMLLNADDPITLYIPAGVGHAFKNPDTTTDIMIFAMYADRLYDPADTVALKLM